MCNSVRNSRRIFFHHPSTFSYILRVWENKKHWCIKPNNTVDSAGHKEEAMDTLNLRLAKPGCEELSCNALSLREWGNHGNALTDILLNVNVKFNQLNGHRPDMEVIYERLLCLWAEVLTTLEKTPRETAFIRKRTSVFSLRDPIVFFNPSSWFQASCNVGRPLRFYSVPNNVGLEQFEMFPKL
jgi:hypothetical protein